MTVPSSGAITMLGFAREKVYSNYGASGTPTAPYSMKDLAEGGNSGGSGVSFEATNTSGTYPNDDTPHGMNEWRSYSHGTAYPGFTVYYYASKCSDQSFANERTIYQDSAGTTLAPSYWYAAGTSTGDNSGKWSNLSSGSWTSTQTCGE